MVFAATNVREVNDRVTRDARERGIWVNQADDPAASDFTTPAQLHRGPVTIAVSAGSAALAVAIRDGLASRFDDRWQRMAEAMQEVRPMLQNDSRFDDSSRRKIFQLLATEEALNVLTQQGTQGLIEWIARLPIHHS